MALLKKDAHPGYLSWEDYEANQARLLANQQAHGGGERKAAGVARQGPALLQGLVLCGKCGRSMTLRYHQRGGKLTPDYVCAKTAVENAQQRCQSIPGASVDQAVGKVLVESVTPLALEVALKVQEELQGRLEQADRLRQQQVQRAQYEADQARVRYMRVDPNNRLVADTLETQWNDKLRLLTQAKEEYEKKRQLDAQELSAEQKAQVLALACDFPRMWNDPNTPDRERKRMARLLLEDVTLRREKEVLVQMRFKGGATRELRLPLPKPSWELKRTHSEVVREIDQLLGEHTATEVAQLLNQREWRSGQGCLFTQRMVDRLARDYYLANRDKRLRTGGLLTSQEIGELIDSKPNLVNYWREQGLLKGIRRNEKNEYYYERPSPEIIQQIKQRRRMLPAQPLS